jgi:hypothetical protein
MKAICIKDSEFDFGTKIGGVKFEVKKNEIYEYSTTSFGYSIQDKFRRNLEYPLSHRSFEDSFIDISKYREVRLSKLLDN